ncbi:flagellar hook-length control protein FliK [Candidatus Latescibacterota bacterium]
MNISGPEAGSGNKIPVLNPSGKVHKAPVDADVRPQNSTVPGDRLAQQLSAFFAKRGPDILSSHITALHAELSALGLDAADIDDTTILNALMLRRHSIPLSKELLETLGGNAPAVFKGVSVLGDNARALLGDVRLTGESRTAIEALLRDINTFFRDSVLQESPNVVVGDAMSALPLKNIIQNSGLAFEWQLLAWYRSGRDPERLRALMSEDLKGVLINFANRAKKNPAKGSAKKKFTALEKDAGTQLKNIENLQLSNILGKHELKKGFCFELPPGGGLNGGHGIIEDDGRGRPKEENTDGTPKPFTVEIDVETTQLGSVHVGMTFAGIADVAENAVSLNFGLESERITEAAENMSGELRANLTSQGYTVMSVDFHRRGSGTGNRADGSHSAGKDYPTKSAQNLDITG